MPGLLPIPRQLNRQLRAERRRRGNPVKPAKNNEVRYRRALMEITKRLRNDVAQQIIPTLRAFEADYVGDQYAAALEEAFDRLRSNYNAIAEEARVLASGFITNVNFGNRERFYNSIRSAIGINLEQAIQNEGLDDVLRAATRENVGLIRSIPDQHFDRVEGIVFRGTITGNTASSMISELRQAGRVSTNRARVIARDQTSKLNGALNRQRQQNLGVEEYVWRTAGDERVRDSHLRNNGRVFRWDDPPDTGHPGAEISCRCVAQPIINI